MGYGHVGSVATIHSYQEAHKFFCSKPAHTRCKGWESHQRCIKERPSGNKHYRIEQHSGGDYYDVCLYSTVMARFYKPDDTGRSRILYAGHGSNTSQSFMSRVLGVWSSRRMSTTDERIVIAPVYNNNQINDRSDLFSLDITVDSERRLVVSESRHTPHYTYKSNAADKNMRAAIKDKFSAYITLAQMRMPEFANECVPSQATGRPFGSGNMSWSQRNAVEDLWNFAEHAQEWIDHFFDMCQDAYNTIASKRGYEQPNFSMAYGYYHLKNTNASPLSDLEKPVTEKDLEKAILNRLYKILNADTKSEAVEQPQFMDSKDYPRTTITTRK